MQLTSLCKLTSSSWPEITIVRLGSRFMNVIVYSFPGSMFLPPTSAFGAGLYSVAVYGGLVLFGLFLLYDTQHVIKRAETIPYYGVIKYDPINA